jgi:uncharacterized membrane protein
LGAEALVGRVLALGAWGSGALVAAGLLSGSNALVRAGVVLLVATPFLRVAAMAGTFARRGERKFALYACAVLLLMCAGIGLGLRG